MTQIHYSTYYLDWTECEQNIRYEPSKNCSTIPIVQPFTINNLMRTLIKIPHQLLSSTTLSHLAGKIDNSTNAAHLYIAGTLVVPLTMSPCSTNCSVKYYHSEKRNIGDILISQTPTWNVFSCLLFCFNFIFTKFHSSSWLNAVD